MGGQLSSFLAQAEGSGGTELAVRKVKVKGKEAQNAIETINERLPMLAVVEVKSCKLSKVPNSISQLVKLKSIILEDNKLSVLPSMVTLTDLRELNLSSNKFSSFPLVVAGLEGLEVLNLSNNQLSEFGKGTEFTRMKSLTSLNLSHNDIETFPTSLCAIANLASLDMSENKLETLPAEVNALSSTITMLNYFASCQQIGHLTGLQNLNLRRNALTALPNQLGNCHALSSIDVSENQLQQLPASLSALHNSLTSLSLQHNKLSSLPDEIGNHSKIAGVKNNHSFSPLRHTVPAQVIETAR